MENTCWEKTSGEKTGGEKTGEESTGHQKILWKTKPYFGGLIFESPNTSNIADENAKCSKGKLKKNTSLN